MKIGIITHYYQSTNYGGNLQAYALQRFLAENHQVEQICYKNDKRIPIKKSALLKELGLIGFFKRCIRYLLSKMKKCFTKKEKNISRVLENRRKAILAFNEQIPHSSRCYNAETIYEMENEYDCFITGSDQVWHPLAVNEAYLLNFVKEKPKFSYAASLAVSQLTEQQRQRMQRSLKNYQDISVREENAISLLKNTTDKMIKWVLDPVFLLNKDEWDKLTKEDIIKEHYLFCYFLGVDKTIRRLAKKYAQKYNLKIVTMPYLSGKYDSCDKTFGDFKLEAVSPIDFISLIKHAKCIFTDSFHAMAFSRIFEKEYFVFNREKYKEMNSRIYSLCELFSENLHFCDRKERRSLKYIEQVAKIDYSLSFSLFEKKKLESMSFLKENLEKAEKKIVEK